VPIFDRGLRPSHSLFKRYDFTMSADSTRHFVTIDGHWGTRQVHYRRSGRGPAVLLLHQSPQSSREMASLMRRWSLHFTLIAPDNPGYGQSDPLGPAACSIEDFAAAVLEFADAIGLRRFGIYGFHTGASIGLWLASGHPDRVTALAAQGLAQLTDAERADILRNYLVPVVPSWDGSHLAWLWARIREQTVFFPWYERTAQSRMDFDMPSAEHLHDAVMDLLRAGDNYVIAYRAAFESQPETVLPGLQVPLLVTAAHGDPLQAHLERLRDLPATAEVVRSATTDEALDRSVRQLLAHPGDQCPGAPPTRPIAGRLWNNMIRTSAGTTRVVTALSGSGEPLLLLHHAGESADAAARLAAAVSGTRPIVIPDLPGHGESDPPQAAMGPSVADCAQIALETLSDLGIARATLAGQGTGGLVALETARRGPFSQPRLLLIDLPLLPAELRAAFRDHGMPSTAPQWHGGHLLLAWHMLRDGRLFFPWFERSRAGARRIEPDLDTRRLQLEVRELLKGSGSWQNLLDDALDYPVAAALRESGRDVVLAANPDSAWHGPTRTAARVAPSLQFIDLPPDPADWLPAMLATPH
jgi:pimeloyl-ACP methyl ester carboxylesterase